MSSINNKTRALTIKFLFHLNINTDHILKEKLLNPETQQENVDEKLELFLPSYRATDSEHPDNQIDEQAIFQCKKFVLGILSNYEKIELTIKDIIQNKKVANLTQLDYCTLLCGTYELIFEKTPKPIVINDLVNFTKLYSSKNSSSFINGALDSVDNA